MRRNITEIRAELDDVRSNLEKREAELMPIMVFDKDYLFSANDLSEGIFSVAGKFLFCAAFCGLLSYGLFSAFLFILAIFGVPDAVPLLGSIFLCCPGFVLRDP